MSNEDVLRAAYAAFNSRDVEVVRDAKTGKLQADTHVLHRWRLEDGLAVRMDVLDEPA